MALSSFPNTPTLAWSVHKAPNWATRMQRAISGRELRVNDYVIPLYSFTLTYEVLHDRWDVRGGVGRGPAYPQGYGPLDELRQILTFYNQQMGASIPFMFNDPTDNTTRAVTTAAQFATFAYGDGATVSFQMASTLLAPVIPVNINSVSPAIGYTVDANTGIITFSAPPANGTPISADFTYSYRVRFKTDTFEAEEFMYQLWRLQKLELISVLS